VFRALDALLIERMRDSTSKSLKPLHDLLSRFDSNHDGFLEYSEIENMFLECQLAFKPQIFHRITSSVFDIGQLKRSNGSKVSSQTLKFLLASDTQQSALTISHSSTLHNKGTGANYDVEPSKDLGNDTSPEELNLIRSGARKIIMSF
jgi:hypothetical protein